MEPQVASEPALFRAELDAELPAVVERGRGTALVMRGRCSAGAGELRLRFAEVETEVWAAGLEAPEPGLEGWSAVLPIPTGVGYGTHELALVGTLGGGEVGAPIGEIEIVARDPVRRPAPASWPISTGDPLVVVCMATREPEPGHLRRQIDSVKAQEGANWICVVSDDASSSKGGRAISDAIAGDPRFIVSRSPSRLGFLGNFERALRMAPVEAGYCALADQDDLWRRDKLATMVAALEADPTARLAFSDFRLVTGEGVVLSDTFWTARRPRSSDLASLLVANQVTGAAALFRRELLEPALPFPPDPGGLYHDHWLALCALVSGGIRYVPRVTYDHLRYDDSGTVAA
ncbi:MAG: glycosyltransferase [Solirubrobacterales bacterium]